MRYRYLIKSGCLFLLIGLIIGGEVFAALNEETKGSHNLLQFTAGRHVLGFGDGKMVVASADHSLRVSFEGARLVAPNSRQVGNYTNRSRRTAQPLNTVTYSNLWEGVTLVCDRLPGSILKSTYHIAPRTIQSKDANPVDPVEQIHLCYNVPVKLDRSGNLLLTFQAGQLRESAPIAWQEIGGVRIPVEANFHIRGERAVGFRVGSYDPEFPLVIDPVLTWQTFMGSAGGDDDGYGIAVDGSGNVYVAGKSKATWGTPINAFSADSEVFVAKLDSNGNRVWHTFMGAAGLDYGYGIAVDSSGNAYVTGKSEATWGSPVNGFTGGFDVFAAKLDSNGNRVWHTFMGSAGEGDYGFGIAVDSSGNVYVTSSSVVTWGTPVNAFAGNSDIFVAKLDSSGNHIWHTYMGSAGSDGDAGVDITVDRAGNVYVTGSSDDTWGTPVNAFAGVLDVLVAKLDSSGNRVWHTFMGSAGGDDYGYSIAVDSSGSVYVAGESDATWGTPVNAFAGGYEAFAARLDSDGNRVWHTFMGSAGDDLQAYMALDSTGNVYVTGKSPATWGTPINAFSGGDDVFVARLDSNGNRVWNTFRGSAGGDDQPYRITVDNSGNVYVTGKSAATWGTPVNAFAGGNDAFAVKIADVSVTSTNSTISEVTIMSTMATEPATFSTQHVIGFTATGVNNGADISINYASLPDSPTFFKEVNGTLKKIYPENKNIGITNVSLDNNALRFSIEDNSDCDTDATIGTIKDPVVSGSYPAPGGGNTGGCFISTIVCE